MAEVLSWQTDADARATLDRALQALNEGKLVAFPTDTGYVTAARADLPDAVEALHRGNQHTPLTLAVAGGSQAVELLPGMSVIGRRLAQRCLGSPVDLLYTGSLAQDATRLPGPIAERAAAAGKLALRLPNHPAILHALDALQTPLAIADINANGGRAINAEQAAQALGPEVALLIDDGPCRFSQGPTVVRINGGWEVVHEGAVRREHVEAATASLVVFVCTGNTCRSPLAEALCRKKLCDRLGCPPEELRQRGFTILSAGVSALEGDVAAGCAVEVARTYDADLSQHVSRQLDPWLARQADHLVGMTQGHLQVLRLYFPELGCEPRLLSPEGTDLPDPVGQEEEVYRTCAAQIWKDLDALVEELLKASPAL